MRVCHKNTCILLGKDVMLTVYEPLQHETFPDEGSRLLKHWVVGKIHQYRIYLYVIERRLHLLN